MNPILESLVTEVLLERPENPEAQLKKSLCLPPRSLRFQCPPQAQVPFMVRWLAATWLHFRLEPIRRVSESTPEALLKPQERSKAGKDVTG